MNRNVIMLVVAVLAVAVVVLGYQLYQERHKSGVAISIGNSGISIEKK
jgi:predicted negative regulator of RcsB-dependent stress response